MAKLILKGWKPGLKKVSLTKLLQEQAGLPLTEAKKCVDLLLDHKPSTVAIESTEDALRLAGEVSKLGAVCEVNSCDSN